MSALEPIVADAWRRIMDRQETIEDDADRDTGAGSQSPCFEAVVDLRAANWTAQVDEIGGAA